MAHILTASQSDFIGWSLPMEIESIITASSWTKPGVLLHTLIARRCTNWIDAVCNTLMIAKDPYRPDDSDRKDSVRPDGRKDSDRPDDETGRLWQRSALPRNHCSHNKVWFSGTIIRVRSQWQNGLIFRSIIDGVTIICVSEELLPKATMGIPCLSQERSGQ